MPRCWANQKKAGVFKNSNETMITGFIEIPYFTHCVDINTAAYFCSYLLGLLTTSEVSL